MNKNIENIRVHNLNESIMKSRILRFSSYSTFFQNGEKGAKYISGNETHNNMDRNTHLRKPQSSIITLFTIKRIT